MPNTSGLIPSFSCPYVKVPLDKTLNSKLLVANAGFMAALLSSVLLH